MVLTSGGPFLFDGTLSILARHAYDSGYDPLRFGAMNTTQVRLDLLREGLLTQADVAWHNRKTIRLFLQRLIVNNRLKGRNIVSAGELRRLYGRDPLFYVYAGPLLLIPAPLLRWMALPVARPHPDAPEMAARTRQNRRASAPPCPLMSAPLLHMFLLTYNREKSFRRTLGAIAASPLREHPLTVMDNCSTDGTPRVCEEFRALLPRMDVRRHARNIGFGANFLRSIELSQGEYTWVLCDDDTLYPERAAALLEVLEKHRPEACFVGGPRQEEWPAGLDVSPAEIQRATGTFLTGQCFVAAMVFKSALIGSRELIDAYFSIRTNFPQFVLGRKLLTGDIPCAVLRPPVLQREAPAEKGTGYLDVVDGWSAVCRTLPHALQRQAFYSVFVRRTWPEW